MPIISFPTQTGDFAYSLAFKKNSTQEDFGFGFGLSGRADPDKERQVSFLEQTANYMIMRAISFMVISLGIWYISAAISTVIITIIS